MSKTRSKSIETLIKDGFFHLFDFYDVLRGKASRMQSLTAAIVIIAVCIGFAFVYILFFSYLPSDENRSSLVSLIGSTSPPVSPATSRLLNTEQFTATSINTEGWETVPVIGFGLRAPPSWEAQVDTATPASILVRSPEEPETAYLSISQKEPVAPFDEEQCETEQVVCSEEQIQEIAFQQMAETYPETNTVLATMSAQQRDILYTIEYAYPLDDEEMAVIVERMRSSIYFDDL
jgi:hypothetical protein